MPESGLKGPFKLDSEEIDRLIKPNTIGVYMLGYKEGNTFYVLYVGRSDTDLNDRLKKHIGRQPRFKYDVMPSAEAAYFKECELFHMFGGTRANSRTSDIRLVRTQLARSAIRSLGSSHARSNDRALLLSHTHSKSELPTPSVPA